MNGPRIVACACAVLLLAAVVAPAGAVGADAAGDSTRDLTDAALQDDGDGSEQTDDDENGSDAETTEDDENETERGEDTEDEETERESEGGTDRETETDTDETAVGDATETANEGNADDEVSGTEDETAESDGVASVSDQATTPETETRTDEGTTTAESTESATGSTAETDTAGDAEDTNDTETATDNAGEERTATATENGDPTVGVTEVTANRTEVTSGDPVAIRGTAVNERERASDLAITLRLFGETVATEETTLAPGERRTVEFVREIVAPGVYDATVNGETVTIRVEGDGSEPGAEQTSSGGLDGFGALAALAALAAFALAGARRR